MAYSVVETRVANPARKGTNKMARKRKRNMSAKQIKYFGTARQRAALKTKRKNSAKKKVYHRPATKKRANPAPHRAKKYASRKRPVHRKRTAKRKNPVPEIISFVMGNPGSKKRRKKTMASKRKHYKRSASRKMNAGRRTKKVYKSHRRRNPAGLGRPMDWIKGGVGVIGGGVGTRVIPQFLGATNTGPMGYALNAITAVGLAWGTHMFTKDAVLTASVAAGGFAALILRMVGDLTPYGSALSLSGFGDYMVSNFVTPQRIVNQRQALWEVPGNGWGGVYPSAVPTGIGQGSMSGSDVQGAAGNGNSY